EQRTPKSVIAHLLPVARYPVGISLGVQEVIALTVRQDRREHRHRVFAEPWHAKGERCAWHRGEARIDQDQRTHMFRMLGRKVGGDDSTHRDAREIYRAANSECVEELIVLPIIGVEI